MGVLPGGNLFNRIQSRSIWLISGKPSRFMKKSNAQMKKRLVARIENHLGWGSGQFWTNKDFGKLSEQIFEITGKQLSVTTLKRVWGRVEPIANLSVTTYDILSEFLGYDSWRDFQQSSRPEKKTIHLIKRPYPLWKWGVGTIVALVLLLIFWRGKKEVAQPSSKLNNIAELADVSFSFDKVASGYPNTVIFQYDLGTLSYDTLCIQQSWDIEKRIPLSESKGLVTSTYYQPGYYLAKLVVDDQIVEERDLYIPTLGWQGIVLGTEGKLSYLKTKVLKDAQGIRVDPKVLDELEAFKGGELYLAYLSDNPVINGDAFRLRTVFRTTDVLESSICNTIRMTVTGTREVVSLAFSVPGCVGDLSFFMAGEMVHGKNHDLSAFGSTKEQWIQCEVVVEDQEVTVLLGGEAVFQKQLQQSLGKIGGVQWYFEGLGEIRELTLEDNQQTQALVPGNIVD